MKRLIYALAIVVLCCGAASAKEENRSFRDPDAPNVTYKKILVDFQNSDYESKVKDENKIREMLKKKGIIGVVVGHEVFFPTREYTEEQREDVINGTGADAVLKIVLAQRDISKTLQTYQTVTQQGTITETRPVISTSDLWNAHLQDRDLKKNVWFGSCWERKFPKELVAMLFESGFIETKAVTPKQSRYSH